MVVVGAVVLDGVREKGHQGLQQVVRGVLSQIVYLPFDFKDLVEELLWQVELSCVDIVDLLL